MPADLRFNFPCPRCSCVLEGASRQAGQTGRCPTCGARFTVPELHPYTGRPLPPVLLDDDDQDPTPMHAYAASGAQAPQIIRDERGEPRIRCSRCRRMNEIEANHCSGCGTPFTLESAPALVDDRMNALGTLAFVMSIISLPLCVLFLPAVVAVLAGLWSCIRAQGRVPRLGLVAVIVGIISIVLGIAALK